MRVLVALFLALLLVGCSGDNQNESQTANQVAADDRPPQPAPNPPKTEPREMIPDVDIIPEGVSLRPYFDEAGTVTEMSAKVGDQVNVYIFAETPEPYKVSACAFRLEAPAGVDYLRETKIPDGTLSLGTWDTNYNLAWPCRDVGRYWVMHYVFTVAEGFTGGDFITTDGFVDDASMFIGFGTCHAKMGDTIRSAGGSITLTLQ